ncbi:MAG TPA: hypothetical protein VK796_00760 [Cytophaga sp.]|jgi:hypothetical protein|nr:hypothetical protein [Cytophaga sp.]
MLEIILYWILLIPLFMAWGMLTQDAIIYVWQFEKREYNVCILLLLGICIVGLLANLISFFYPLGNDCYPLIILYIIAGVSLFNKRNELKHHMAKSDFSVIKIGIFITLLALILIKSASPSELLDEKGYYLPFIKWIEEYGITTGLANVLGRFGFNSAWHITSALLSLRWSGFLFYDLNGFLILVVIAYNLFGIDKEKTPMRFAAGLFVSAFIFRNFITSSSSDLPNIYLTSTLILFLIEKFEKKNLAEIDFTFVAAFVIACFNVTLKPSSLYMMLIFAPTISMYLYYKKAATLCKLILLGLLFAVPWLARFYITTGYIIYPVPGLDLFNPEWKVPAWSVLDEYLAVKTFPISDTLPAKEIIKMSVQDWFPMWFKNGFMENKVFFVASIIFTLYYAIRFKKFLRSTNDLLLGCVILVIMCNIAIWFFQYPDFRFAWGYILLYVFLGAYLLATDLSFDNRKIIIAVYIFLIAMTCMHFIKTIKDSKNYLKEILITQASFPKGEVKERHINNMIFYESDKQWDLPLPSILWWQKPKIELRDKDMSKGFKPKSK